MEDAVTKRAILSDVSLVPSYSEGKNTSTTLVINDDLLDVRLSVTTVKV